MQRKCTILLVRHGEPESVATRLTSHEFSTWLETERDRGLVAASQPPDSTKRSLSEIQCVFTSDASRSMQSAILLASGITAIANPLFQEVPLPRVFTVSNFRLSVQTWMIIARILWMLGHGDAPESRAQAKLRARDAVDVLVGDAHAYGAVALVGHGVFNMLIGQELRRRGWSGPSRPGVRYWDSTVYSCDIGTIFLSRGRRPQVAMQTNHTSDGG